MTDTPQGLAVRVAQRLRRLGRPVVSNATLGALFSTMYYASLQTEESEPIRFAIVFLDPSSPDPHPPPFPPQDRWSYTRLSIPLPFEVSTLVKLAGATDPRSSALAVWDAGSGLTVWGLVDQQSRFHDFLNYDSDSGPERPGVFQAHVIGPGHVAAFVDFSRIGELRIDRLERPSIDVMSAGPVKRALDAGIAAHIESVGSSLHSTVRTRTSDYRSVLRKHWIASLSRILQRAQSYHHGGAVLLTNDDQDVDLNVKYPLSYDRMREALDRRGRFVIENGLAYDTLSDDIDRGQDVIPTDAYLDYVISQTDVEETASEINGASRFLSLLTRVDGLLLLRPTLEVLGFGVEITPDERPGSFKVASARDVTPRSLTPGDYQRYGTRHRSMLRYCWRHPGSIGFVISQDDDVRAIMRVGPDVVMWEKIRLQVEVDFWRELQQTRQVQAERALGRDAVG